MHREAAAKQDEVLKFMRTQSEETKARVNHSISLQEASVKSQKRVQSIALPLALLCLLLIVYLMFRYNI